jgi:hypothetical protein
MWHRLGLRFRKTELNHIREIQGSSSGVEILNLLGYDALTNSSHTVKMEAAGSFETSATIDKSTWRHIPEEFNLNHIFSVS